MKLGVAGLQCAAVALAAAGIFAAPLRAQVALRTASTNGTQQAGVAQQTGAGAPSSDLLPVIQMFTGGTETWDVVASSGSPGANAGQSSNGGVANGPGLSGLRAQAVVPATVAMEVAPGSLPAAAQAQVPPPAQQGAKVSTAAVASPPNRPLAQSAAAGKTPAAQPANAPPRNPQPAARVPQRRPPDFAPFLF